MSNPEPQGFPQSNSQSGANWPFATQQGQAVPGQQPAPAFPAPAAPPAQDVPQYSQQPAQASSYPLAGGSPVPAAPLAHQVPEESVVEHRTGQTPIVDAPVATDTANETLAGSVEAETDTASAADDIQESLHQQALTPWWLDGLMALSLAGVMVFNGFGMSIWLRIGSLIVMVVALIVITWYQGDAQEKSNTFLTGTLLGAVCGFLAGLIVVAASLYLVAPIPTWYPWVLWLVSAVLLFLTYRGFRDWVMRNLQKKSHRKSSK